MDVIVNTTKIQVIHYEPEFSAICSIGRAPFHGTIEISYSPEQYLLEFESFENWLRSEVATKELTIEDLAQLVFNELIKALGDIPLSVIVHGRTTVHAPVEATITQKGFWA